MAASYNSNLSQNKGGRFPTMPLRSLLPPNFQLTGRHLLLQREGKERCDGIYVQQVSIRTGKNKADEYRGTWAVTTHTFTWTILLKSRKVHKISRLSECPSGSNINFDDPSLSQQTLVCPVSGHGERQRKRKKDIDTERPQVSLELTATQRPLLPRLLAQGPRTSTHTHTHCSPSHKGPHGNGAFRSPVALFMQRCITMGTSHQPALPKNKKKACRSAITLCLLLYLFLSFLSLTRPSAPPPSQQPPSALPHHVHHHWQNKEGFSEREGESRTEYGHRTGWMETHSHSKQ